MLFEEKNVKSRKEVIQVANDIIRKIRETGGEYTIVWGRKANIKYIKDWKAKKYKAKSTPKETNKALVNVLKAKYGLGEQI